MTRCSTRVHKQHLAELPHVRYMLVATQNEIDFKLEEQREEIAGVPDDVSLSPGSRNRHEMVMENEDPVIVGPLEGLTDPVVSEVDHLSIGKVGLGRVDRDERGIA